MVGDVVHQSSRVRRVRETVMDLVMEVNMTVTLAARETSCVVAIIAKSSGIFITRRTTAVRLLNYKLTRISQALRSINETA